MNRRVFRAKRTSEALKAVFIIAVIVVLVALVHTGINNLSSKQEQKQLEIAQDAIIRAAVQCYALESQFPPSLQHLVDNYGLTIDEERFIYHYRVFGSNMVPEIKVFPRNPSGEGR